MPDWNTSQYLKFKNQRTQPAIDLAMRIQKYAPRTVVDIGCGPGNSTAVLQHILPEAKLLGIDASPNMIEKARAEHPDISFSVCDALSLAGSYDLLFSNACLQWIAHHEALIPALMHKLNDHGVLAVQIPMNGEEPLYQLIEAIVKEPRWGLAGVAGQPGEILAPNAYFRILAGCSSSFEMWETKYYHSLPSHKALVEWVKGTRLRPYLEQLDEAQSAAFENEIAERAKAFYPVMENGEVLLGFRRFFFTAIK